MDIVHTTALSPFYDLVDEGLGDLLVVYEVYLAEPYVLVFPRLVGVVVYYCGHPSYRLSVAISHERLGVGELQSGVFLRIVCVSDVDV